MNTGNTSPRKSSDRQVCNIETPPLEEGSSTKHLTLPLRKVIWSALELAIETQAKRLARDIASALAQDPAPLLKSIRDDTIGVYLFDEAGDDQIDISEHRCNHLIVPTGEPAYLSPCWNPALWKESSKSQTKTCLQHSLQPSPHGTFATSTLVKLKTYLEYYIDEEGGYVYDKSGKLVGRFIDSIVYVFELSV